MKFRILSKLFSHSIYDDFFATSEQDAVRIFKDKYKSNKNVNLISVKKIKTRRKTYEPLRDYHKGIKFPSVWNDLVFMNGYNFNDMTVNFWEKFFKKEGLI